MESGTECAVTLGPRKYMDDWNKIIQSRSSSFCVDTFSERTKKYHGGTSDLKVS